MLPLSRRPGSVGFSNVVPSWPECIMKRLAFALGFSLLAWTSLSPAQTFANPYNFMGGSDGANPWSTPIRDVAGNLYGTTYAGGYNGSACPYSGCGAVYKFDTNGNLTLLYTF